MQSTSVKSVAFSVVAETNRRNTKDSLTSTSEVDYSIFRAKEIRDILKSKAHCLQAGFSPTHPIIKTMNEIRDHYLLKVGLPTYISQMLGELGQAEMQYCALFGENSHQFEIQLNNHPHQTIQRFIARSFHWDELPFRVEVRRELNSDRVEVRYL